jgi:hypothetical protein
MRKVTIIIAPAATAHDARMAAAAADPDGPWCAYALRLCPVHGEAVVSHYAMSRALSAGQLTALAPIAAQYGVGLTEWDVAAEPGRFDAVLAANGLRRMPPA